MILGYRTAKHDPFLSQIRTKIRKDTTTVAKNQTTQPMTSLVRENSHVRPYPRGRWSPLPALAHTTDGFYISFWTSFQETHVDTKVRGDKEKDFHFFIPQNRNKIEKYPAKTSVVKSWWFLRSGVGCRVDLGECLVCVCGSKQPLEHEAKALEALSNRPRSWQWGRQRLIKG